MTCPSTMQEYALAKTGALLDDVVFALHSAARLPDADAVHKMRVSIRRLQQALRLFAQYLKPDGPERIKPRLRAVMQIAGELRNRDIAMELVGEAGGDTAQFQSERKALKQQLGEVLKPYAKPDLSLLWREELGLETTV